MVCVYILVRMYWCTGVCGSVYVLRCVHSVVRVYWCGCVVRTYYGTVVVLLYIKFTGLDIAHSISPARLR